VSDEDALPPLASELIRERIHTIEGLEVVLALRAQGTHALELSALASSLRITEAAVNTAIDDLVRVRLVVRMPEQRARYSPESEGVDRAMTAVAETYQTQRVETLVLIANLAIGRVRSSALHTFAEAFRLRGPKK
jgi:hypothetical protein